MGKIYWIGNHDNLESCLNQLLICCEILDKSLFFSGPLFCSLWTIFHREAWFIFIEGLGPYNHNLPLVSCYTFLQRVIMMFTHYSVYLALIPLLSFSRALSKNSCSQSWCLCGTLIKDTDGWPCSKRF